VYAAIAACPSLRLDGVMGYEAQIAGVGDKGGGFKGQLIRLLKRRSIPQLAERRKAIVDALKAKGAKLRFVNGGGTGSIESTIQEDCVTEVTTGSGFYAPGLFDHYRAFKHQPAAGYAIEIVRRPQPQIYTCLGGGYVASGEVGLRKQPVPYLPEGAQLIANEGAGEVQTPVVYSGPENLSIGDPIFMRHAKAGELCERFNSLYLISGGKIVDEVPTYRGEGKNFL
jgi:D-serine deaminase-like pyridoxal phosphate-dependent protein